MRGRQYAAPGDRGAFGIQAAAAAAAAAAVALDDGCGCVPVTRTHSNAVAHAARQCDSVGNTARALSELTAQVPSFKHSHLRGGGGGDDDDDDGDDDDDDDDSEGELPRSVAADR